MFTYIKSKILDNDFIIVCKPKNSISGFKNAFQGDVNIVLPWTVPDFLHALSLKRSAEFSWKINCCSSSTLTEMKPQTGRHKG